MAMDKERGSGGFGTFVLVVAVGLGIGGFLGWLEFQRHSAGVTENFLVTQSLKKIESGGVDPNTGRPIVKTLTTFPVLDVVGGEVFNFGVSEPGVVMEHTFEIRNLGTAPLELRLEDTTCKCLTMDLDRKDSKQVAPGESFDLTLQFFSEKPAESFVQQARIMTNDPHPNRNVLKVKIEGRIVSRISVRPEGVSVNNMTSRAAGNFTFNVYAFEMGDVDPKSIDIQEIVCDNPALAEWLSFDWEELGEDDLRDEYQSKHGYKVTGTAAAGMPMGNYAGVLKVKTTDGSEFPVDITMSVKAPVAVQEIGGRQQGVQFFDEAKLIDFGLLQGEATAEIRLMLVYRTERKGDLELSLDPTLPEGVLEAEFEDVRTTAAATLARLRIAVRADCPPIQLNGPKRDNMAKVTVRSNSDEAPEVNFSVKFSKR